MPRTVRFVLATVISLWAEETLLASAPMDQVVLRTDLGLALDQELARLVDADWVHPPWSPGEIWRFVACGHYFRSPSDELYVPNDPVPLLSPEKAKILRFLELDLLLDRVDAVPRLCRLLFGTSPELLPQDDQFQIGRIREAFAAWRYFPCNGQKETGNVPSGNMSLLFTGIESNGHPQETQVVLQKTWIGPDSFVWLPTRISASPDLPLLSGFPVLGGVNAVTGGIPETAVSEGTVWICGKQCRSWFFDDHAKIFAEEPWRIVDYLSRLGHDQLLLGLLESKSMDSECANADKPRVGSICPSIRKQYVLTSMAKYRHCLEPLALFFHDMPPSGIPSDDQRQFGNIVTNCFLKKVLTPREHENLNDVEWEVVVEKDTAKLSLRQNSREGIATYTCWVLTLTRRWTGNKTWMWVLLTIDDKRPFI